MACVCVCVRVWVPWSDTLPEIGMDGYKPVGI